jgi:16S rRNA (cytosine967-C5)-methyltransferase
LSRYHAYLKKAVAILALYKGQEPFSIFSKQQFSLDRRMGATDRRWVRHYCYCFFRMGKALTDLPIEERILLGIFLCGKKEDPLLALLRPEWNQLMTAPVGDKLPAINFAYPLDPARAIDRKEQRAAREVEGHTSVNSNLSLLAGWLQAVFPFQDFLSATLQQGHWPLSVWEQPLFFIRLRPDKEDLVCEALKAQQIDYEKVGEYALGLAATTSLDSWPGLHRDFVVQDLSSQRIAALLRHLPPNAVKSMWDCCAGSGGKSILAIDTLGPVNLTVSDKRKSILKQLKERFAQAGLTDYQVQEIDLTKPIPSYFNDFFSLIWADVPCSGSGTWSRTPEQLYFFESDTLAQYKELQRSILQNAVGRLQPGGYLLYSTCSVFAMENEQQVAWLEEEMGLSCIEQQIFDGTTQRADTLYAALLQKQR